MGLLLLKKISMNSPESLGQQDIKFALSQMLGFEGTVFYWGGGQTTLISGQDYRLIVRHLSPQMYDDLPYKQI